MDNMNSKIDVDAEPREETILNSVGPSDLIERGPRRMLYVTTYSPKLSTLGGASWVDLRILEGIRETVEVEVLTLADPDETLAVPLEVRRSLIPATKTIARMISKHECYLEAKFRWHRNWTKLTQKLSEESARYDLVLTSQWPALMAAHDAQIQPYWHIAHNADYVLAQAHDPKIFKLFDNMNRTQVCEARYLKMARGVLCLSKVDCSRLANLGAKNVGHLNLHRAVGVQAQKKINVETIGFIGKSSWPPNEQDIRMLDQSVIPALRKRLGREIGLCLAGAGTEQIAAKLRTKRLAALGPIPDVDKFYAQIDLVVVPRAGEVTGVSVKVLEALEHGKTVIASREVCDAIGDIPRLHKATSVSEIVDAIVRLSTAQEWSRQSTPVTEKPAPSLNQCQTVNDND